MIVSAFRHPFQAAADIGATFHRVSVLNVRLGKDVVGCIRVHYGRLLEIPYSSSALDVLAKHRMETMIEALEKQGYGNISLASLLN